jgi:hypothetical protein
LELIRHQPAAFVDLVNGELPGEPLQPDPDENPENAPEYCKCGCCVAMPTQLENKCCTQTRQPCITLALTSHRTYLMEMFDLIIIITI